MATRPKITLALIAFEAFDIARRSRYGWNQPIRVVADEYTWNRVSNDEVNANPEYIIHVPPGWPTWTIEQARGFLSVKLLPPMVCDGRQLMGNEGGQFTSRPV